MMQTETGRGGQGFDNNVLSQYTISGTSVALGVEGRGELSLAGQLKHRQGHKLRYYHRHQGRK